MPSIVDELAPCRVVGRSDGRGVAVVGVQPGLEDLRIVVLADRLPGGLRLLGALDDAVDELALVDLELDAPRRASGPCEASIASSASACATVRGKPSRMKPFLAVRLLEPVGDDADDDLVGDELARIHHRLGLHADRRAGRHRGAQHVAGRELRNAVLRDDARGLSALARPRRPQEDQIRISASPLAAWPS